MVAGEAGWSPTCRTDHGADDQVHWDEQQIVAGIAAGQAEARAALVRLSHDAVFAFACRLSPDVDLRRDWTHDCLLRIITDLESGAFTLRHPGGFWSWFRKRSWFLLLEARRTHRRRGAREVLVDELPDRAADRASPLHDFERARITEAVVDCLERIEHDGQRQALGLLLLRDCSYQETADALLAPLNTVRAWIRRGRLDLRRCLARRLELAIGVEDGGDA
ncbi:MAG TPA: sigma-70 family RNA polymerase sigma factor [Candidatus Krumholzibacteria bacterium]|nr:sigma-70 family RNA polymerase sigma factor [Candidatus Krumholzibacteria bacterium]